MKFSAENVVCFPLHLVRKKLEYSNDTPRVSFVYAYIYLYPCTLCVACPHNWHALLISSRLEGINPRARNKRRSGGKKLIIQHRSKGAIGPTNSSCTSVREAVARDQEHILLLLRGRRDLLRPRKCRLCGRDRGDRHQSTLVGGGSRAHRKGVEPTLRASHVGR